MSSPIDIKERKGIQSIEEHRECTSPIADPQGGKSAEELKYLLQNIFPEPPCVPYPLRFGLIDAHEGVSCFHL